MMSSDGIIVQITFLKLNFVLVALCQARLTEYFTCLRNMKPDIIYSNTDANMNTQRT